MLKKVLLTIVAILVAGGALMIYGTYKAADEFVKDNEPQLRQYVQMDEAAQNAYVLAHADEIISQASAEATEPEDKKSADFLMKVKDDPAVQKAATDLGRAIMAAAVLHSDSIMKDLNTQLKEKFQKEKDNLSDRLEKYADALEAAEAKLKGAQ